VIPGMRRFWATVLAVPLLAGCSGIINQHKFTPVAPQAMGQQPSPSASTPGAIYQAGQDMRLFEDRTARRVGDILTIRLVERTNASKKASTSVDKESEVALANPTLFGKPLALGSHNLETSVSGTRDFKGSGESDQSNSLSGEISAVVTQVYPNGNLVIRGEKMLTLNQGEEFVQISGVVRPEDVGSDNSVLSTQVADAQITYAGKGALADANAVGWLGRFFLSPLWPF
jgi:flagellar L-ring protein precursor FlgH